jgi:hypothetical protein
MRLGIIGTALLISSLAFAGTTTNRLGIYIPSNAETSYASSANPGLQNIDDKVFESPGDWIQTSPATETDEFDNGTTIAGKWSWVNQGAATITQQNGYQTLTTPADSSISHRMRVQTAPSKPFTITARCQFGGLAGFYRIGGVVLYNSSAGTLAYFGHDEVGDTAYQRVTGTTGTPGSQIFNASARRGELQYLRIAVSSTTMTFSDSFDGVTWDILGTENLSTFIESSGTIDKIGFAAGTTNGTAAVLNCYWFRKS